MNNVFSFSRKPNAVRVAIAPEVLTSLVEKGQLHAVDFRCLDTGSKRFVWKMLLSLALSKTRTAMIAGPLSKE